MPRRLNTYLLLLARSVPGVHEHHRQVEAIVAAPNRKAAAAAMRTSAYHVAQYGMEGNEADQEVARAHPGVVLYRPDHAPEAPWVPWGRPYPLDAIPPAVRSPEWAELRAATPPTEEAP